MGKIGKEIKRGVEPEPIIAPIFVPVPETPVTTPEREPELVPVPVRRS